MRYRISLEQRHYPPSTINLRLAAVRRIALNGKQILHFVGNDRKRKHEIESFERVLDPAKQALSKLGLPYGFEGIPWTGKHVKESSTVAPPSRGPYTVSA
jgi:hypothetical protein